MSYTKPPKVKPNYPQKLWNEGIESVYIWWVGHFFQKVLYA